MRFTERSRTYDKLGRVASQVVRKGPGPVQIARQDLAYFGNDNPSTLGHVIGASNKQFQFGYDRRHQIISASELTTPGYFASSYSYGTAGRFTRANLAQSSPPAGSELVPRNVDYQYADPDPERVTGLVDVTTLLPFKSYRYDETGNQTLRCNGELTTLCASDSIEFLYDGKNQLRRATKKNAASVAVGSEEYWYDGDGTRIAIVKRDANNTKAETVWFLEDVEAHYDQSNLLFKIYAHLSMGTPIGRVERNAVGMELEYQFHGLASHTLAAIDSTGTTNVAFSYSPFGEILESIDVAGSAGTAFHQRRFNDKQHDQLTELSYYGARYFDRVAIAWTQSDPLYRFTPDLAWSDPRLANLYVFSKNNALRYVDPDGLKPLAAHVAETLNNPVVRQAAENAGKYGPVSRSTAAAVTTLAVVVAVVSAVSDPETTSGQVIRAGLWPTVSEIIDHYDIGYTSHTPPPGAHTIPFDGEPISGPGQKPGHPYRDDPDAVPEETEPEKTDKVKPLPYPPKPKILPPPARVIPKKPKLSGSEKQDRKNAPRTNSRQGVPHKPADADGDGKVTEQEESDWMRAQQ